VVAQETSVTLPRRTRLAGLPWATLSVVSVGGALGALARLGVNTLFPARPDAFPWATFGINVSGCLLIGVLMVLVTEVLTAHRLVRPFLGVGVLGGYTTFSTYIVDIKRLIDDRVPVTALLYLAATVLAALVAVWAGVALTRAAARWRRREAHG
jgi:CrcB protein